MPSWGPTCGQSGYINAGVSGIPNVRAKAEIMNGLCPTEQGLIIFISARRMKIPAKYQELIFFNRNHTATPLPSA